jgi:hypothetical protein
MVRYTLEKRVYVYTTYVKYRSVGKCWLKFWRRFCDERVPSRQTIRNLVYTFRSMGLLMDKKQKHKRECLLRKSYMTQEPDLKYTEKMTEMSSTGDWSLKSSARRTQLLTLRPYKTTVIHTLQSRDPASGIHFCSWFLQPVVEGEIDPQLTFFSDERGSTWRNTLNAK